MRVEFTEDETKERWSLGFNLERKKREICVWARVCSASQGRREKKRKTRAFTYSNGGDSVTVNQLSVSPMSK